MRLLIRSLAEIELPRLAIVVGEALGTDAPFLAVQLSQRCEALPAFRAASLRRELGATYTARRYRHLHVRRGMIPNARGALTESGEIVRTEARQCVSTRRQTALQRIMEKSRPSRYYRTLSNLFGFG